MEFGNEKIIGELDMADNYYGVSYKTIARVQWYTLADKQITCLLKKRTRRTVKTIDLLASTSQPLKITVGGASDTQTPMVTSEVSLRVQNLSAFQTFDLYKAGNRSHSLEIYLDDDLIWQGFMIPEFGSEKIVAVPYETSLRFIDGLALLKSEDFVDDSNNYFRGIRYDYEIINTCLRKIGIERNFIDQINIYDTLASPAQNIQGTLSHRQKDTEAFRGMSCWGVIEQMMMSTISRLEYRPNDNKYYIKRLDNLDDVIYTAEYDMSVFDATGMGYVTDVRWDDNYVEVTSPTADERLCWQDNSQTIERIPGWQKCVFRHAYGKKPSVLPRWNFSDDDWIDDDNLKFWNHNGIVKEVIDGSSCVKFLGKARGRTDVGDLPYEGEAYIEATSSTDYYSKEGIQEQPTEDWGAYETYQIDDSVIYNEKYYKSLTSDNTGNPPENSLTDWEEFTLEDPDFWALDITVRNGSHESVDIGTYYGPRGHAYIPRPFISPLSDKYSNTAQDETFWERIGVADWFRNKASMEMGYHENSKLCMIEPDNDEFKIRKEYLWHTPANGMKVVFRDANNLPGYINLIDDEAAGYVYSMIGVYETPAGNYNFKLRKEWPPTLDIDIGALPEDVDNEFPAMIYFSYLPVEVSFNPITEDDGVRQNMQINGKYWLDLDDVNCNFVISQGDLESRTFIGLGLTMQQELRNTLATDYFIAQPRIKIKKPKNASKNIESNGEFYIESVKLYIEGVADGETWETIINKDNNIDGIVNIMFADTPIKGNFRNNRLKYYNNFYTISTTEAPNKQFYGQPPVIPGEDEPDYIEATMRKLIELYYIKTYKYARLKLTGRLNSNSKNPIGMILEEKQTKKRYLPMRIVWDVTYNEFSGVWHEIGDAKLETVEQGSYSQSYSQSYNK